MTYKLYDLKITVTGDPHTFNCSHTLTDELIVEGENIRFGDATRQFSHYALATLAPYIAAKQRTIDAADWMSFEDEIACPDPRCGARFCIARIGQREYDYSPITQ